MALSALLSVGLLAACSGEDSSSAPSPNPAVTTPAQPTAGPTASPTASPAAKPTAKPTAGPDSAPTAKPTSGPSAKPSLPPDPEAPTTVRPVKRAGSKSAEDIRASSATFAKTIRWSDGVRLRVVDIEQGVTNGVGAGATQGAPRTTFRLELTNGSGKPVDVSSVVLTTVYGGKSKLVAQPVYDTDALDFSGIVGPGSSSSASYAYIIPSKQLGAVSLTVDLDGRHALASFHGSVR